MERTRSRGRGASGKDRASELTDRGCRRGRPVLKIGSSNTPTSGQEPSMRDKPISDLRRRMIADMTVRSFSDKTQHDYIRHIETFARFLGRSPDTANGDDIRRFQLAQVEQGAQPPKTNTQASALRFFFTITLGRADLAHQLARTHYPRKLPRVLAREQVGRLIEAAPGPGLKYKTALSIAYGAGLRGGEVVMLRVGDIDSKRMRSAPGKPHRQIGDKAFSRPSCSGTPACGSRQPPAGDCG